MDKVLQSCHINSMTLQKWVSLMLVLLDEFMGNGHSITMDFTFVGDIMAQIVHEEWQLNMVRTSQSNQTGANVKGVINEMKAGTCQLCFWQQDTKNLCT